MYRLGSVVGVRTSLVQLTENSQGPIALYHPKPPPTTPIWVSQKYVLGSSVIRVLLLSFCHLLSFCSIFVAPPGGSHTLYRRCSVQEILSRTY